MSSELAMGRVEKFICPQCHRSCSTADNGRSCPNCELDLKWLNAVREFQEVLAAWAAREVGSWPNIAETPKVSIEEMVGNRNPEKLSDFQDRIFKIGRESKTNRIPILDPQVSMQHCLIAYQERDAENMNSDCYWIADNCSEAGTFINGRRIIVHKLTSSDLLQVGSRAWMFSQILSSDKSPLVAKLLPVGRINGIKLELRGVGKGKRLQDVHLQIAPGEFVAFVGPSGGGKSTLMRTIVSPSMLDRGEVLVDEKSTRENREEFRSTLGYVSQKDALHTDLTALQAVEFAARLRRIANAPQKAKEALTQVDLPDERHGALCHELSGGELKRVRAAAEMVVQPRLFVLDEPDSGLDDERGTILMRLLRCLSYRGCTILVVTHNPSQLEHVDRVLKIPSGEIQDSKGGIHHSTRSEKAGKHPRFPHIPRLRDVRFLPQLGILIDRELALLGNAWLKRLVLPVLVVPLLFATAIGISVPVTEHSTLGFLAILSCIWMGSSLSLMSIVDQREAFDHERLLFLHIRSFVFSKVAVLGLLSILQTIVFVLVLWLLRGALRADAMLYGVVWCAICLSLVSLAAVGMGLVISALAGTSRPTANFILPLVMMFQIVFSVQIVENDTTSLHEAYGKFHGHECAIPNCSQRAELWKPAKSDNGQAWMPGKGSWRCTRCWNSDETSSPNDTPQQVAEHNASLPNLWAARASYLTLSRYADIALRGFAYSMDDYKKTMDESKEKQSEGETVGSALIDDATTAKKQPPHQQQFAYRQWMAGAILTLMVAIIALPSATVLVLYLSEVLAPEVRRFFHSWSKYSALHNRF